LENKLKKHRYIFAKYFAKPRDPHKTHIKGYMADPNNVRYDESVGFSVGLKKKDWDNNIIIDIDGQKVVKNSINENGDWTQLMGYFLKNYEKQLLNFLERTGGSVDANTGSAVGVENSPSEPTTAQ
jgi:hypothetical protein